MATYTAIPQLIPHTDVTATQPQFFRLTLEQYHRLVDTGVIGEDAHVELLEGYLVAKMTKNPPHTFATQQLRDLLRALLPLQWTVNDQEPLTVGTSEPEPDCCVLRGTRRALQGRRATAADAALVIEVADTWLDMDRGWKLSLYALAGIVAYWIVNIPERRVEVYGQPDTIGGTYAVRTDYAIGETVPVVLDGVEVGTIPVAELFA